MGKLSAFLKSWEGMKTEKKGHRKEAEGILKEIPRHTEWDGDAGKAQKVSGYNKE